METSDPLEDLVAACIEALGQGDLDAAEAMLRAHPSLAAAARAQLDDLARTGLLEDHPREIGAYRILEPLGRGGMGAVYLAEQRSPVVRRVALKLVKRGMDTRDVLARFAAERQALALMSHPNIARVFDAGSSPDGRPFFVMEHVAGLPITTYCERKQLDTEARIGLLLQVCDGVQHAHHKGVVHRDLKPSNVLVAEQDGRPVPKIIDFGIAKATDQRLGGATLHTAHGVVLGTPEYMSPEQAGRDALDVDLRTDVWSLGVLLYELLTGELPYASERLRTDAAGLQRVLREEQPPTPSRRLETRVRAGGGRSVEVARRLRGDLDWICMKALEKDRERRYSTVQELAADLRRHLAHEPVLAGPPSTSYRIAKFVRRHRVQVGAAAAVLIALVAGLVTSLVYQRRAADALTAESIARAQAERDFRSALDAVHVLLTRVADARLEGVPRMERVRRTLLEDAARCYEQLLASRPADRGGRRQSAESHVVLAHVLNALGQTDGALTAARRATRELDELLRADPRDDAVRFQRAQALDALGQAEAATDTGDPDARFAAALDDYRQLLAHAPDDERVRRHLVGQLHNLAFARRDTDRDGAIALWREAIAALERGHAGPENADWRERMAAVIHSGLAGPLLAGGDIAGADAALQRARSALDRFDLDLFFDVDLHEAAADVHRKLAVLRYRTGDSKAAIEAANQEIAALERLARDHPENPAYRGTLATAYGNLAVFRSSIELDDAALQAFRDAADTLEDLLAQAPDAADRARSVALYSGNLAQALIMTGRRADLGEARRRATRALELVQREPTDTPGHSARLGNAFAHLVDVERCDGRSSEARAHAAAALRAARDAARSDAHDPGVLAASACAAAQLALENDDAETAAALLDEATPACEAAVARTPDDPRTQETHATLAWLAALVALAGDDVDRAAALARSLPDRFAQSDPLQGLVACADVLTRAAARSTELIDEAERACRAAIEHADTELAVDTGDAVAARQRAVVQVALASLIHARGDAARSAELLGPAIGILRDCRAQLHVDATADRRLSEAIRLRIAIARAAGDARAVEANLRTLRDEFGATAAEAAHPTSR